MHYVLKEVDKDDWWGMTTMRDTHAARETIQFKPDEGLLGKQAKRIIKYALKTSHNHKNANRGLAVIYI